jgi:hypothetical protein
MLSRERTPGQSSVLCSTASPDPALEPFPRELNKATDPRSRRTPFRKPSRSQTRAMLRHRFALMKAKSRTR